MNYNIVKFKYTLTDTREKGVKMKRKSLIAISCILSTLILGIVVAYVMPAPAPLLSEEIVIKAVSDVSELGDPVTMPDIRNSTFSVAVVVEDTNLTSDLGLFGFDVQFNWTTEWISYTGYTVTVPVEDYPAAQPPSPYAGILHEPIFQLKKVVNEDDAIPSAEPGTMAWIGYAIMPGAALFNGSGTICVFTFNVTNQPFNYEGSNTIKIHFLKTDISDSVPSPIPHTAQDLEITLHPRKFEIEYPASPMLKVSPDFVTGLGMHETFSLNITLLGADGAALDPFWDVAGCDFYLNFNTTLIEAVGIDIDPDGDFGAFWADGTFELAKDIDNAEGSVHIAFMGLGATHDPVNCTTRIATIDFNVIYESELYPEGPLDLENPLLKQIWYVLDAEAGVVDLSMPVTTEWLTVFPVSRYGLGFNLTGWEDVDSDGELSVGDQVILLNKDTLKWHDYRVDDITGTLQLTQDPFACQDDYVWPTDSWTVDGLDYCGLPGRTTESIYGFDGQGHADWTGNFTLKYPFTSVNSITANFVANDTSRVLTEGVDYKVHADDDLVELVTPVDVHITNEEWIDVNGDTLSGWPPINYTATSIQSVYVKFPNGTERSSPGGFGCFQTEPPCEWWFEPDYPCELEGWYVLGYMGHDDPAWPVNSTWWINYTAGSYLTIDYSAEPDPRPYYVEFEGDYADFLVLSDPTNTSWHEVYPRYCVTWNLIAFDDADSSGTISIGDVITLNSTDGLVRDYEVDALSTDIKVILKPCVQDLVPGDYYYTDSIIVDIAGFAHPERLYSPWFGRNCVIRLPNAVDNSTFQAIPEFSGLLAMLPLLLAAVAIVATKKFPKKK